MSDRDFSSNPIVVPERVYGFGPFRLAPQRRLLVRGPAPVAVGSRALSILILLVERAGELVRTDEILNGVWPGECIGVANLHVHIAALRKAIGDEACDNHYILNERGRGYRFIGEVTRGGGHMLQDAIARERRPMLDQLRPVRAFDRVETPAQI